MSKCIGCLVHSRFVFLSSNDLVFPLHELHAIERWPSACIDRTRAVLVYSQTRQEVWLSEDLTGFSAPTGVREKSPWKFQKTCMLDRPDWILQRTPENVKGPREINGHRYSHKYICRSICYVCSNLCHHGLSFVSEDYCNRISENGASRIQTLLLRSPVAQLLGNR